VSSCRNTHAGKEYYITQSRYRRKCEMNLINALLSPYVRTTETTVLFSSRAPFNAIGPKHERYSPRIIERARISIDERRVSHLCLVRIMSLRSRAFLALINQRGVEFLDVANSRIFKASNSNSKQETRTFYFTLRERGRERERGIVSNFLFSAISIDSLVARSLECFRHFLLRAEHQTC